MAEKQDVEYLPPPEFQTKSPLDFAKISPGGIGTHPEISEQFRKASQGVEDYAKALEDRFAQPNWFKVAAGFAKPQLGGFLASLGSASEEFGRQQEAARAISPTVAKMRAEVASGQLGFQQRMAQKEMADLINAGQIPLNSETLRKLGEFGTETDIYKAAKQKFDTEQTIAGTKSTQVTTSAREQELMRQDPYYIPLDKQLQTDWNSHAQKQNEIFKTALLNSGLFNQQQLNSMTPEQLQDRFDEVTKQQAEKRLTDLTTSGQVLANNMTVLSNLAEARKLSTAPEMGKLLGIGSGQDAVSALIGYITSNDQGNYNKLAAATQKLATENPDLYAKFVVLQKALNTNVTQARELVQNPSNNVTGLLQSTYPNVAMPQKSIVTLLDLMAAQNVNDARIAALRQSERYRDVNPNVFESSKDYQQIKKDLLRHKTEIIDDKYYKQRLPSQFYQIESIFQNMPTLETQKPVPVVESAPPVSSVSPASPAPTQTAPAAKPAETKTVTKRRLRSAQDIINESMR